MKKLLMTLLSLSVILAACAPGAPTEDPSNIPDQPTPSSPKPTPTRVPVDLTPAERAAIEALSEKLGMPADEIGVVSTEAVEWPDGCLGVQRLGMMCTQAIVPGFKIILEAGGKQYEYHTNQNGSSVVLAQSPLASGSVVDVVIKQLEELFQKDAETLVSNNNRNFVKAMFSWEQNGNQLLNLLKE